MNIIVFNEVLNYTNIDDKSLFDLTAYYGKKVKIMVEDEKPFDNLYYCQGCGLIITPDNLGYCPECGWEIFSVE